MPTFVRNESGSSNAIEGHAVGGRGIIGTSVENYGVRAVSRDSAGLRGSSEKGRGVEGWAIDSEGVVGISTNGNGVWGQTEGAGVGVLGTSGSGSGVVGQSRRGVGVWGVSDDHEGVHAETRSPRTAAVAAYNLNTGSTGAAIYGEHKGNSIGVLGVSRGGAGLWGVSQSFEGVHAETNSAVTAAIAAFNLNPSGRGAAIFARKAGDAGHAGFFEGRVWISGQLDVGGEIVMVNGDCAEDFDVEDALPLEPGTVVIIGADGGLRACCEDYDTRVAGVISGAGSYRPALVLDRKEPSASRRPVALMGKVFCHADADAGAIAAGDLLTTASMRGHAMRASDRQRAFGAVIGKALAPLARGRGLIPMLVAQR